MSQYDQGLTVMLTAEQIHRKVVELGQQITRDYAGKDLVCIGVLKGCFPFLADLVREIELPLRVDFLGVSSYGDRTKSSGVVRFTSDLSKPVEGLDVLIVEDIVDTGLTMRYLLSNLKTRGPRSLAICTLLHKPDRTMIEVELDYIGFTIPDRFVIGYGLDYAEIYRNLPFIGVLGS
ncbi:MAG: hypoxanthine phosphoribosyltransferase [Bradymonadales bacterium]|nr:hypoxanthine phosphoribosyltransferase [Bradymonadales bacterium]